MLKKLYPALLSAALALTGLGASAQTTPGLARGACGFDEQQAAYFAAHPAARVRYDALNQMLAALPQQRGLALPTVTIPVVVHIIHAGGAENISDRQVNSAIAQLNTDYQKLNADTANTIPLFRPIAANLGFQFRLAKLDPNGNCTTGITRTYAPELINDDRSGAVKSRIRWDTNRYLNIWLVSTIGTPTAGGGFILGYAQFPGQNGATDGLVIRNDYFGDQGTGSPNRALSRTGTHEIGHYFGLLHPWGNGAVETPGNCGDTDFIADTPPTIGTYTCNLSFAPCGPIANVQNFMDYASCATMFTQDQKSRMVNVLQTIRTSLTTAANLAATGTNDGFVAPNCAPIAAFAPAPGARTSVCVNTPVTLRDYSSNFTAAGGPLVYSWSAPGATIVGSATGQTITVTYAAAGFYSITETVGNNVGSTSSTQTNIIRVEGPTGAEMAPYAQSFEDPNFPNLFADPTLRNYTTSGVTSAGVVANYRWARQAALPAADGSAYLIVSDRLYTAGAVTTLVTPNINLGGVPNAVLSFYRSYALRNAGTDDQLRISYSTDCGLSWSAPTVFNAADLSTQGQTPIDGFAPASAADWQRLVVAIPAQYQGSGLFKLRLQMVNGSTQGNNFYFDNLRVSGPLATKASALAGRGISVYPNPLTNETAVHLSLATATKVQVSLTDVLGRTVLVLPTKMYGTGQQTLSLQNAARPLRAGLYVVRIVLDGETFSSKLTVE